MAFNQRSDFLWKRQTAGDKLFTGVIYALLVIVCMITLLPILQVVTVSLSPNDVVGQYGLHLFPTRISLSGYQKVLQYRPIWDAYANTILRAVLGVVITQVLLALGAYPLSKKYLPNRGLWMFIVLLTMYFSGGIVPSYILITKYLKLRNTIWALVLPPAVNAYTLVIVRNFFEAIPDSLEESARIDGASEWRVLISVVIPLSKPVIATTALWSLVFHWNTWLDCMLYISDASRYVLQMVLRQILLLGQLQDMNIMTQVSVNNDTMKMATLVVSILPVIAIYPFIQKYFVKGVMIGAVKG
ncbi:ABC transporter permease [Clostridia bacterium]|nr:ABC transporter permease [Clostridia bacterium]